MPLQQKVVYNGQPTAVLLIARSLPRQEQNGDDELFLRELLLGRVISKIVNEGSGSLHLKAPNGHLSFLTWTPVRLFKHFFLGSGAEQLVTCSCGEDSQSIVSAGLIKGNQLLYVLQSAVPIMSSLLLIRFKRIADLK